MKIKLFPFFVVLLLFGLTNMSCNRCPQSNDTTENDTNVILKDYGSEPTVLDIDSYTMSNDNFRTALWTGTKLQVTLMSIPVGCDVGLEQHPETDQFLRIEDGQAKVVMGDSKEFAKLYQNSRKRLCHHCSCRKMAQHHQYR